MLFPPGSYPGSSRRFFGKIPLKIYYFILCPVCQQKMRAETGISPFSLGNKGKAAPGGAAFLWSTVWQVLPSARWELSGGDAFQHGHILGEHRGGLAALGVVPRVEQALLIAGDQAQLVGVVTASLAQEEMRLSSGNWKPSSWGAVPPVMDCM